MMKDIDTISLLLKCLKLVHFLLEVVEVIVVMPCYV